MARISVAYILSVLMIAASACSGGERSATSTTSSATGTQHATVALITHQAPGDTFWDPVRRGAEAAAAKDDLDLQYSHDPDAAAQASLVRSAVSGKVAGIAVTLADPAVMAQAVQSAIAAVDSVDRATVKRAVIAKLQQDFSIDRILTLGAPMALAALEAVAESNSYAKVASFDTNKGVVDAIKNRLIEWAIDQQPFLQGYLAIDSLWLYFTNKNVIGGGQPTLTGPSFVDETNINSVADLAEAGTR